MAPTFSESRPDRRTAALRRMRSAAKADGLAPARIAELEGALEGAFAIKDLMDLFGKGDGRP